MNFKHRSFWGAVWYTATHFPLSSCWYMIRTLSCRCGSSLCFISIHFHRSHIISMYWIHCKTFYKSYSSRNESTLEESMNLIQLGSTLPEPSDDKSSADKPALLSNLPVTSYQGSGMKVPHKSLDNQVKAVPLRKSMHQKQSVPSCTYCDHEIRVQGDLTYQTRRI